MANLQELRQIRLEKLKLLKQAGMNPYPAEVSRTHSLKELKEQFSSLIERTESVSVVGRILSIRGQGAIMFVTLFDGTERFQVVFKKDEMDATLFELFVNAIDLGDFVQISGIVFVTQRGAESVLVKTWTVAAKALIPIPTEYFGIEDEDDRLRKRYLDILLNQEVADVVRKRSIFWNTFRSFLLDQDFVEVETPVLENTTGGAEARPFITHHNALDIDVYLRISCGELWQKKLLVGGIPRTFEIGRIFRNEGMSAEHLQDYTQLEFYMAFSDYREGMEMIKALYREVAEKTFGTLQFTIKGFTVDLASNWLTYDFVELIQKEYGINVLDTDVSEIEAALKKHGIEYDPNALSIERGTDLLWKKIRKTLDGPGFLINVPVYLEPLAKKNRDNPQTVERFQVIIAGSEVGKGFSELNDPVDQKERFMKQQALRDAGDDEAQMADMEYVEAMEYGMPPAFGFGVSERLFSFLLDKPVRESQIFPLMKPKE